MRKRKTYVISREVDGAVACTVMSRGPGVDAPLVHVALHSPTGFEIGYLGSGPADLALSILADHFDVPASIVESVGRGTGARHLQSGRGQLARAALQLHQLFKLSFLTRNLNPGEVLPITTEEISFWAETQLLDQSQGLDLHLPAAEEAKR